MIPTIGVMIGAIGVMIAFYVITQMGATTGQLSTRLSVRILATITVFVAILCVIVIIFCTLALMVQGVTLPH